MVVGVQSRHPDCVFNSVGTTVRKEDFVSLPTGNFDDTLCGFSTLVIGVLGCNGRQFPGLLNNRGNNFWVLVTHIDVHEL